MAEWKIDADEIRAVLRRNLDAYRERADVDEVGTVFEAGDGIARVHGLPSCMAEEMLEFPRGIYGMALNLEDDDVGVILLGDHTRVEQGSPAKRTGKALQVPVGEPLLGRVVNAIGMPIDGKGPITAPEYRPVERAAPNVIERQPVREPLQTGLKCVDSMIPIGRGQRELIIGDRQTGKTALALDTILNQRGSGVVCVYVSIGQKLSTTAKVVETLREHGALEYTTVVAADSSEPAALQFVAPYAGCAMGEYFRDRGGHALVVFDDLYKQAVAYRQISLLLRRPPGREAFPGDIFNLHARLLERAAKLREDHVIVRRDSGPTPARGIDGLVYEGPLGRKEAERNLAEDPDSDDLEIRQVPGTGGSLTALPIVETQEGDFSAYIPTNGISITDGQIYLESGLFHRGIRPAVAVGLSVSRVGGSAQRPAMKKVAGRLRLDLAQYSDMAAFAQLSSDLDPVTRALIRRGERMSELLKQPQYEPMPLAEQVAVIWGGGNGYLDDLPLDRVSRFETGFRGYLRIEYAGLLGAIESAGELSDGNERILREAADAFASKFRMEGG